MKSEESLENVETNLDKPNELNDDEDDVNDDVKEEQNESLNSDYYDYDDYLEALYNDPANPSEHLDYNIQDMQITTPTHGKYLSKSKH